MPSKHDLDHTDMLGNVITEEMIEKAKAEESHPKKMIDGDKPNRKKIKRKKNTDDSKPIKKPVKRKRTANSGHEKTDVEIKQAQRRKTVRQILVLGLFLTLLLSSAIAVTKQINDYRQSFNKVEKLRTEEKKLNTEWHKLILEQQTFGATTRVESRALLSMGMLSPKPSDIITINLTKPNTASHINSQLPDQFKDD